MDAETAKRTAPRRGKVRERGEKTYTQGLPTSAVNAFGSKNGALHGWVDLCTTTEVLFRQHCEPVSEIC